MDAQLNVTSYAGDVDFIYPLNCLLRYEQFSGSDEHLDLEILICYAFMYNGPPQAHDIKPGRRFCWGAKG